MFLSEKLEKKTGKVWAKWTVEMQQNRNRRFSNQLKNQRRDYGQGQNRTAATRIFSSLAGAGLYDTIGHYMYLFTRLTAVSAGRFYRFEHIVSYSSFKVLSK